MPGAREGHGVGPRSEVVDGFVEEPLDRVDDRVEIGDAVVADRSGDPDRRAGLVALLVEQQGLGRGRPHVDSEDDGHPHGFSALVRLRRQKSRTAYVLAMRAAADTTVMTGNNRTQHETLRLWHCPRCGYANAAADQRQLGRISLISFAGLPHICTTAELGPHLQHCAFSAYLSSTGRVRRHCYSFQRPSVKLPRPPLLRPLQPRHRGGVGDRRGRDQAAVQRGE